MPTQSDIANQLIQVLGLTMPELDTSIGSPVRSILDATAEVISEQTADQYLLSSAGGVTNYSGTDLDAYCAQFGITRYPAKAAVGSVTFSRTSNPSSPIPIPAGTQVTTSAYPAITFYTLYPATLPVTDTTVTVPVQASVGGSLGNVASGAIITIISSLPGISGVTNGQPIVGGADAESDDQLQVRFSQTVFRSLTGTQSMYQAIALADPNVNQVNFIGAAQTYREQITISGGTGTSSVPDLWYYYSNSAYFGQNLAAGQLYAPGANFTISSAGNSVPPTVNIVGGSVPDGVYDFQFDYISNGSRNDPLNGRTNAIDIYVNGLRPVEAVQDLIVPASPQQFNSTAPSGQVPNNTMWNGAFTRTDGFTQPVSGHYFIPLAYAPIYEEANPFVVNPNTLLTFLEGGDGGTASGVYSGEIPPPLLSPVVATEGGATVTGAPLIGVVDTETSSFITAAPAIVNLNNEAATTLLEFETSGQVGAVLYFTVPAQGSESSVNNLSCEGTYIGPTPAVGAPILQNAGGVTIAGDLFIQTAANGNFTTSSNENTTVTAHGDNTGDLSIYGTYKGADPKVGSEILPVYGGATLVGGPTIATAADGKFTVGQSNSQVILGNQAAITVLTFTRGGLGIEAVGTYVGPAPTVGIPIIGANGGASIVGDVQIASASGGVFTCSGHGTVTLSSGTNQAAQTILSFTQGGLGGIAAGTYIGPDPATSATILPFANSATFVGSLTIALAANGAFTTTADPDTGAGSTNAVTLGNQAATTVLAFTTPGAGGTAAGTYTGADPAVGAPILELTPGATISGQGTLQIASASGGVFTTKKNPAMTVSYNTQATTTLLTFGAGGAGTYVGTKPVVGDVVMNVQGGATIAQPITILTVDEPSVGDFTAGGVGTVGLTGSGQAAITVLNFSQGGASGTASGIYVGPDPVEGAVIYPVAGGITIPTTATPLTIGTATEGSFTTTPPGNITLAGTDTAMLQMAYTEGSDYWYVNESSIWGQSSLSRAGLECTSAMASAVGGQPAVADYYFNQIPASVQQGIQAWRLVTTDVMIHQANEVYLNMFFGVILSSSGQSLADILPSIEAVIVSYLATVSFDGVIQVAELLSLIQQTTGITAVRFLNNGDWSKTLVGTGPITNTGYTFGVGATYYAMQQVNPAAPSTVLQTYEYPMPSTLYKFATDVQLDSKSVPSLNGLYLTQLTSKTYGPA